jgi:flagellar basal body-associated protein FliL
MSKETAPQEAAAATPASAPPAAIPLKKLIIIGIPVFVVQLALVYFIASKFLVGSPTVAPAGGHGQKTEEAASVEGAEGAEEGTSESQIFIVKDIIVNPAGTNGQRFLLTTIGIEAFKPTTKTELEKKEFQVRDALNSVLCSKGLLELSIPSQREFLRKEIQERVGEIIKTGKIKNVYFSKFIIQ